MIELAEISISELQKLEDSLVGLKRKKKVEDEFIATVNHELRTPLTSIVGSLRLLAGGLAAPLPNRAKRLIEIAYANSERLARFTRDE